MLKVVHEIGAAREISKKNESIAERDPKHPYNPAHALKNQEDLHKQPIAKIFERWPRYSEDDLKNIPPYTPCFGIPTPPKGSSKQNYENIKFGVVVADLKMKSGAVEKKCVCDTCGREYKYASGLSRHKKNGCLGGDLLKKKDAEISTLKRIIESNENLPSITDLFFELTERSHQQILELKNENKRLKSAMGSRNNEKPKKKEKEKEKDEEDIISKLDTINLRKINAVCNKKIQELTDENERMKDYNENVVLPGVKEFQQSTNEKISDLEAEIERLKAKIKAYES